LSIKNVTVPDLGGAADVDVIEVLVKPGDTIKLDTPLLTLESDKATMDVPSADEGVVREIKIKVGDKVSTGTVILTLEAAGAETDAKPAAKSAEKEKPAATEKTSAATEKSQTSKAANTTPPAEQTTTEKKSSEPVLRAVEGDLVEVHAGPAVRRIAREFGVELADVPATGPKQRILKEDIQSYVKDRLSQVPATTGGGGGMLPQAPTVDFSKFGPTETQALSRIKKLTGKNLHRNWLIVPHVTQFGEADITGMEDFRLSQKAAAEKQNVKLTPLVFIMKAVTASLKAFPNFNSSLDASGENLILKQYYNIGVAVDTPEGLVVPVIRDVDKKGLHDLARELSIISEKARKKELSPADMQGGCFSISSLGGIGGTAFTPIVNVPEVAILGVSKASQKPVYQDGAFVPRLTLPLSLSYDHRVIDGAAGARFIVHLANMLSDIRNLLL
jgi:pyruvate dehydrogenase E2 component (dihydrolipoamide acetyltransferase)